jgi:hypothetical protein
MMKRSALTVLAMSAALLLTFGHLRSASAEAVGAGLSGYQEVPLISTTGSGVFFARINPDETAIEFFLLYEDLQGGAVTAAHIHLGQPGVNGGIAIHLCGTGGKAACPASPASIGGQVGSGDVVAIAGQGLAAGDLAAVIRAIRKGDAYANVHTTTFTGGEVRGQIR